MRLLFWMIPVLTLFFAPVALAAEKVAPASGQAIAGGSGAGAPADELKGDAPTKASLQKAKSSMSGDVYAVSVYSNGFYYTDLSSGGTWRLTSGVPYSYAVGSAYAVGIFSNGLYVFDLTDGGAWRRLSTGRPSALKVAGGYAVASFSNGWYRFDLATGRSIRLQRYTPANNNFQLTTEYP